MSLRNTIAAVTKLAEAGVFRQYAIAGAVAALNYIEPTLTEDLDILVSIAHFETRPSGLILLTPIEKALDIVSAVLLVAALCFYFLGGGASKDRAAT